MGAEGEWGGGLTINVLGPEGVVKKGDPKLKNTVVNFEIHENGNENLRQLEMSWHFTMWGASENKSTGKKKRNYVLCRLCDVDVADYHSEREAHKESVRHLSAAANLAEWNMVLSTTT